MLDKKNYKIDVSELNTVERTRLQEELFKMGYYWIGFGKVPKHLDENFLFLYEGMDIAYSGKSFFLKSLHTLLPASDILPQTIQTITLRDLFAGLAMIGLIPTNCGDVATASYRYADAMMEERNKRA